MAYSPANGIVYDGDSGSAGAQSTIDNGSKSLNGTNGRHAGTQVRTDFLIKKALVDARRKQVFMQQADTKTMPKNHGKVMKQYFYVPMLDDRNLSTEGIGPDGSASTAAGSGALYGGSKEVGAITGKLPSLGETGGRKNRVGFTRELREGTIEKYGIFTEYTQDALDFDTDAELYDHMYTEMMNGASELTEDLLQLDLLTNAGTVKRPGDASGDSSIIQPVEYIDLLNLAIELDDNRTPRQSTIITGTRNIDTKVVAGVRYMYIGSELIPTLRRMEDLHGKPAWIPVEQYAAGASTAMNEVGAIDQFRFIVHPEMMHWADAGGADAAAVVPASYAGDGSTVSPGTFRSTGGADLDLFPMLCIGEGSFSTIGFQTNGKTVKFKIIAKKPGVQTADSYNDPYGEKGFVSLKFWYGFLLQRPERLALVKTVAYV